MASGYVEPSYGKAPASHLPVTSRDPFISAGLQKSYGDCADADTAAIPSSPLLILDTVGALRKEVEGIRRSNGDDRRGRTMS